MELRKGRLKCGVGLLGSRHLSFAFQDLSLFMAKVSLIFQAILLHVQTATL